MVLNVGSFEKDSSLKVLLQRSLIKYCIPIKLMGEIFAPSLKKEFGNG